MLKKITLQPGLTKLDFFVFLILTKNTKFFWLYSLIFMVFNNCFYLNNML